MFIDDSIPNESGVYCLVNTVNGKHYIGFSKRIRHRILTHKSRLSNNLVIWNPNLQNDWNLNPLAFVCAVIELTENKSREEYWTRFYNAHIDGYNLSIGTRVGTQAKLKLKGKTKTIGFTGRQHSKEAINKMIASRTGLTRNDKTKEKMSQSALKIWETRSKEVASKQVQGSKNPGAKLKEAQVKAIKMLISKGKNYSDIANMYEVTPNTIGRIATGRIWKHIEYKKED